MLLSPSIAFPPHDKDFRVVNEPVGNRGGDSCGVKHLSPFSKGQIGCQNRRFLSMPLTDNLKKEV